MKAKLIFILFFFISPAFCQPIIEEGIRQYREGKFEEAEEILKKARERYPDSSIAAFFLGLTYKQMMMYKKAEKHLRDAVLLTPHIKEALIELIDVLLKVGKLEEAKRWIKVAEEKKIFPAKTSFLKGLLFQKEGKYKAAIKSFEKAKMLDKDLSQACDFQIGLSYIRLGRLKEAKKRFEAVVSHAPYSDLAEFARRYHDLIEKRLRLERPLRITLFYQFQYDDNVVLRPSSEEVATGITGEQSIANLSVARADFIPKLPGRWLFSASYIFFGNFHRRHSTTHDITAHTLSISPGYSFKTSALNIYASYSYIFRHKHRYMDSFTIGPLFRKSFKRRNLFEIFAGYTKKRYLETPLMETEDRDSIGMDAYISWSFFFKKEGFLYLRYEFLYDDTKGKNWENFANRISLNLTLPLLRRIRFQLSGDIHLQHFKNRHTVFLKKRKDHTYSLSAGFIFRIFENTDLIVQYSRIRCDSNVAVYDYRRNLLSTAVEIRF